MAADTMAVGEAPETQAEQQQQQHEQAEGVEGVRETAYIAPAATTSEHASAPADEMNHPTAEVPSEEQSRAVTFVEPGATNAGGGAYPKRHRVRAAAREAVEENLLPRVERIRQASNVVLDEAAYDPSLRFILIALTLFFIFLVILLANNILG